MPSSKDFTKYIFRNKQYGKARLVLAVLTQHATTHHNVTYDDLKKAFPASVQSNTEIQFSSNQVVFDQESEIPKNDLKRFFIKEDEVIQLKDCKVAVSKEWNRQNIQNFMNVAGRQGHEISVANKHPR